MAPAFVARLGIFIAQMTTGIRQLRISCEKGFDINKINFGGLLPLLLP